MVEKQLETQPASVYLVYLTTTWNKGSLSLTIIGLQSKGYKYECYITCNLILSKFQTFASVNVQFNKKCKWQCDDEDARATLVPKLVLFKVLSWG